ncbi:hypothetical protein TNIN_227181 [Trichonephila inaurata madagascariensis]|uniref:Uncharacterized protein n=1 Tax=Trichonephila inaurata madagascariensis TaxID=2747483 RepID=A0A8X6XFF1_9ARAC|nr:hypothetical protein TNIN_227181 [Trichonephila inaurata madagascariensis]
MEDSGRRADPSNWRPHCVQVPKRFLPATIIRSLENERNIEESRKVWESESPHWSSNSPPDWRNELPVKKCDD